MLLSSWNNGQFGALAFVLRLFVRELLAGVGDGWKLLQSNG